MADKKNKLLSLCIPTNGISEWVFPVLDSIYCQHIDNGLFEVIVTDNGDNQGFFEKMTEYAASRSNLIYKKTDAYMFENQIEAFRLASGEYLKLVNHRFIMEPGSIDNILKLLKNTANEKPVIFFSNGTLKMSGVNCYNSFDKFICGLREYASWSGGVGVWHSDFEKISVDKVYDKTFPHADILLCERNKEKYIIDDSKWSHDIEDSHIRKGKYDLYRAFGIEAEAIVLNLYIAQDISLNTLKYVISSYENLVSGFYLDFSIMHQPCSYYLDGFNDSMGVFLSKRRVKMKAFCGIPRYIAYSVYKRVKKRN